MSKPSKNDIVLVADNGNTCVITLEKLIKDIKEIKKHWELDPETVELDRTRPLFYLVELGIVVNYFTIGLILKCGFNTIFIKTQKQVLSVCGNSKFKKEELKEFGGEGGVDRYEGVGYIKDYIAQGSPVCRSSFGRGLNFMQRMKRDADAFENGQIIVGEEDFIDAKVLKKQKPIPNYEKKLSFSSHIENFCNDFLKQVDPQDIKEQNEVIKGLILRPLELDVEILANHLSQLDKYKDLYNEMYEKYQKQYLKKMKQLYPIPMF